MDDRLKALIDRARATKLTAADCQSQRRSFAYGNTKIENDRITRKIVEEAESKIADPKQE